MDHATTEQELATRNNGAGADPSPGDRRGGLERRRGDRRHRLHLVLFDRRAVPRRDVSKRRRLHRAIDVEPRNSGSKLIHAILQTPLLDDSAPGPVSRYRVSVREGLVATVYSAWEKATPRADGGLYRRFEGEHYRRIGSRLQDVLSFGSVEEAEEAYRLEYQRAYDVITAEHPVLLANADAVDGEIVSR